MPGHRCPDCGQTWPENYCPSCRRTIQRVETRSKSLDELRPVPRGPRQGSATDRTVEVFSRRRGRQGPLIAVFVTVLLSLGAIGQLTSPQGISAFVLAVVMVFVIMAGVFFTWTNWRCPACGQSPGRTRSPNYCGACGIPLAEGAPAGGTRQTPERAEWVVATLRHRRWWVLGAFVLLPAGGGYLAWRLTGTIMRTPLGDGIVTLSFLGVLALAAVIRRCPECNGSLGPFGHQHFCIRCGVPHDREGLERERAQV